jgi:putative ABC transport system permease protein
MPPAFQFPTRQTGAYVPMAFTEADRVRNSHSFYVLGRLREGVTFDQATEDFARIGAELAREHPANEGETSRVTRAADLGMAPVTEMLRALAGAAAFVLLIACVNVANLQISSALDRRREFVVQQALGAGAGRIARQLFAGGLLLAGLGAAGGVGVAWLGARSLDALLGPDFLSFWFRGRVPVEIDAPVLGFAAAAAAATALLFSFAPLIGLRRSAVAAGLADGSRGAAGSALGLRRGLVAAEVALAVVVLSGAGLLVKSVATLLAVDPGLASERVLTVQVSLPQADTYGPAVRTSFCDDIARGAARGAFEAVGAISHLPLAGANATRGLSIDGRPHDPERPVNASYRLICPGYFRTLGIPLIRGRDADPLDAEPVVVINRAMADYYWPDADPLGQRLRIGRRDGPAWMRIVGVAENVRHFGLDADPVREIYVPYRQNAWPTMTVVVRTAGATSRAHADALVGSIRAAYPDLPTTAVRTMDSVVGASVARRASFMRLLLVFAGLGLLLAAVGVYGVLAYAVVRRVREIGIRMALGADRRSVVRLVLRQSFVPIGIGLAAGGVASIWSGQLLASMLFQTTPGDAAVTTAILLLVLVVGLAASWLPARRAASVEPVSALRQQ